MIDLRDSLSVLVDDNGVVTDYSSKMATFSRDAITLNLVALEDYILVGFEKPINSFYVDIPTSNGNEGELTLEYWNGTEYTACEGLLDDTLGLYRGGHVKWHRSQSEQSESVLENMSRYWYRITLSEDKTDLGVTGLNLIFSDDYELSLEQPYINDSEFLGTELNHIRTHFAVKREVLQRFRNKDYIKINEDGLKEDINVWDLHDIEEVKLASTFLALSKVYYQLSDSPDDVWASKSKYYEDKFNDYIRIARLSLDTNDDGIIDVEENKTAFKTRFLHR